MPDYRFACCYRSRVDVDGRMRKAAARNVLEDSRRQHLNTGEHQRRGISPRNHRAGIDGCFGDGGLRKSSVRESGESRDPIAIIYLYYAEVLEHGVPF